MGTCNKYDIIIRNRSNISFDEFRKINPKLNIDQMRLDNIMGYFVNNFVQFANIINNLDLFNFKYNNSIFMNFKEINKLLEEYTKNRKNNKNSFSNKILMLKTNYNLRILHDMINYYNKNKFN